MRKSPEADETGGRWHKKCTFRTAAFPPAEHYETASRSDTSVIRGIGRHPRLAVLRSDARTPVPERFAVGRNARRLGRLLPPQTCQIGAYSPEGRAWMEQLKQVLETNIELAINFFQNEVQGVSLRKPEGT